MKTLLLIVIRKLAKIATVHREVIILQLTRLLWGVGFSLFTHLGFAASTITAWQWIAEPAAAVLFGSGALLLSHLMKRWSVQKSKATVRIAVAATINNVDPADLTKMAIADVPDSIHAEALAKVVELNKNGGVPAPNDDPSG